MKWEYKLIRSGLDNPYPEFDIQMAGKDGWELVTVNSNESHTRYYFYFKRPIKEDKKTIL